MSTEYQVLSGVRYGHECAKPQRTQSSTGISKNFRVLGAFFMVKHAHSHTRATQYSILTTQYFYKKPFFYV
jgi:hypothetical protein